MPSSRRFAELEGVRIKHLQIANHGGLAPLPELREQIIVNGSYGPSQNKHLEIPRSLTLVTIDREFSWLNIRT
jgi:hypothetical protein